MAHPYVDTLARQNRPVAPQMSILDNLHYRKAKLRLMRITINTATYIVPHVHSITGAHGATKE
jgi:hypothetical protein